MSGGPSGQAPPFPGGTSVSHLQVYDWPASDGAGLAGSGTPHLHTVASEGYVVLRGAGSVQTLSPEGYAETPLVPGTVVWFTPGVVHRLVNDGGLEILVVMSAAGLPEAGDAVLTFPADVLADVDRYREAAQLPGGADEPSGDLVVAEAARRRRDLAVAGFADLRARYAQDGPSAMDGLYSAARRLVADRVPGWQETWEAGPAAAARDTAAALVGLASGATDHLGRATVATTQARPGPRRYGMCGRLQTWPL